MFNIIIYICHALFNDLIIYTEGAVPYLFFDT